MKTAFITGASKGIGSAIAAQMIQNGYTVFGTSRQALNGTKTDNGITMLQLNLDNSASILEAINYIKTNNLKFDFLINNAAIGPDLGKDVPELESLKSTFNANVFGTVMFTEEMLSHLNSQAKIINISSKMGSIGMCAGFDSVAYRMSKTALNMYTKILTNKYKDSFQIATIHPGWVRTGLTDDNVNAPLSIEESGEKIFKFLNSDYKTGIFWNAIEETEIEW